MIKYIIFLYSAYPALLFETLVLYIKQIINVELISLFYPIWVTRDWFKISLIFFFLQYLSMQSFIQFFFKTVAEGRDITRVGGQMD